MSEDEKQYLEVDAAHYMPEMVREKMTTADVISLELGGFFDRVDERLDELDNRLTAIEAQLSGNAGKNAEHTDRKPHMFYREPK